MKIQLLFTKHILKTLVAGIYIHMNTIQVMPSYFHRKHYDRQFKIVSWIILLINIELSKGVGYYIYILHKNTPQTHSGCITIVKFKKITRLMKNLKANSVMSLWNKVVC